MPIGTQANGLDGFATKLVFNTPLHEKLLASLVELQKDKTFDYSGRTNTGEGRFTSGECAIFLTSSGFYGNVSANAKFAYTNMPMPYYDDVKGAPQNSIIGGASLWVMGGKSADEYKGIAKFFTFLSDTDRQVQLHEKSGYIPITKAAYDKTKAIWLLRQDADPRDAGEGTHQQGADREFTRPALWQSGADPRRLGRGDRGGAGRQEDAEGGARRGGGARQYAMLRQFERTAGR